MKTATKVIDGQAEALALLRQLETLNWERNAPRSSTKAVQKAMRLATSYPAPEFGRFTAVVSHWLAGSVVGLVPNLDNYEAAVQSR